MVDAGRDQPDVLGVGSIQTHQLARLERRRGQDPVRRADHALLALQANRRLGPLISRERIVLDLAERVERGDERRVPDLLHRSADPARQPVVAVHDVVRDPVEPSLVEDAAEELGQVPWQVRLRQRRARPGLDRDDPGSGRDLFHLVIGAAAASREDVHVHPLRGEPARHLEDVDVHAARIPDPRLIDGRGVDRQHGNPWRVAHEWEPFRMPSPLGAQPAFRFDATSLRGKARERRPNGGRGAGRPVRAVPPGARRRAPAGWRASRAGGGRPRPADRAGRAPRSARARPPGSRHRRP